METIGSEELYLSLWNEDRLYNPKDYDRNITNLSQLDDHQIAMIKYLGSMFSNLQIYEIVGVNVRTIGHIVKGRMRPEIKPFPCSLGELYHDYKGVVP